jgi:hypothetical protein
MRFVLDITLWIPSNLQFPQRLILVVPKAPLERSTFIFAVCINLSCYQYNLQKKPHVVFNANL